MSLRYELLTSNENVKSNKQKKSKSDSAFVWLSPNCRKLYVFASACSQKWLIYRVDNIFFIFSWMSQGWWFFRVFFFIKNWKKLCFFLGFYWFLIFFFLMIFIVFFFHGFYLIFFFMVLFGFYWFHYASHIYKSIIVQQIQ